MGGSEEVEGLREGGMRLHHSESRDQRLRNGSGEAEGEGTTREDRKRHHLVKFRDQRLREGSGVGKSTGIAEGVCQREGAERHNLIEFRDQGLRENSGVLCTKHLQLHCGDESAQTYEQECATVSTQTDLQGDVIDLQSALALVDSKASTMASQIDFLQKQLSDLWSAAAAQQQGKT